MPDTEPAAATPVHTHVEITSTSGTSTHSGGKSSALNNNPATQASQADEEPILEIVLDLKYEWAGVNVRSKLFLAFMP